MAIASSELHFVNILRCLAAELPTQANSGHPGAPIGCAPMAHVLFTKHMMYDPSNALWPNRDRFVLSNGHACALQYSLLHLTGYDLSLEDLKKFRQLGSRTPGHPERGVTPGIEVTTGPLGQGFASAVGLAIAQTHFAALYNKPEFPLFNHHVYVIMGDGCAMEGITSEAASLAGHLRLGNLIVLYDDNHITIDGKTDLTFSEDVLIRFSAYGWHVSKVHNGDTDLNEIDAAINIAKSIKDRPSLIAVRTTIGYKSTKQDTAAVHGSPLSVADLNKLKSEFGLPSLSFHIPDDALHFYRKQKEIGQHHSSQWHSLLANYTQQYPTEAAQLHQRLFEPLPTEVFQNLPTFSPSDPSKATRELSGVVLNEFAKRIPHLMGGSADLSPSTKTELSCSFDFHSHTPKGRHIRFGVREHAMCAIANGLHAYGGFIPFTSTFLSFLTYCLPSVRLAALSHHQCLYIFTHDSIALGEDGPTHQPVEVLQIARSIPNLTVIRPADGNEVVGAYSVAIARTTGPTLLSLTRQSVPHLERSCSAQVSRGAYVLVSVDNPQLVLVASGSEVHLCVAAAKQLEFPCSVVSMPSSSLFDEQPLEYRESVFPPSVPVLSVEMSVAMGWEKYAHAHICMATFGASAKDKDVMSAFGFTVENVVKKAKQVVEVLGSGPLSILTRRLVFTEKVTIE
jgi:transketolase